LGDENRKHERFEAHLEVEVRCGDGRTAVGITRDLSDGGVLLSVRFEAPPEVGEELEVCVAGPAGDGVERPVLKARVVRVTEDGLALAFLGLD